MTDQKHQPGASVPSRRGTHLPTRPAKSNPPATPDQMTRRVDRMMEQVPHFVGSRMALRAWAMKEMGLTVSQVDQAMIHVARRMREAAALKAEDTRAHLLGIIDSMLPLCWNYKTGTGEGKNAGTVLLKHPETGELLREVDHGAVAKYIDQIAELTGIRKTGINIDNGIRITVTRSDDAASAMRTYDVQAEKPPAITNNAEIRREEKP